MLCPGIPLSPLVHEHYGGPSDPQKGAQVEPNLSWCLATVNATPVLEGALSSWVVAQCLLGKGPPVSPGIPTGGIKR